MKIAVLMENTASAPCYACEHGLSLYLEACGKKILFDSGASGAFAENAEKLGIDLAAVDIAILSHGHSDHSGGLLRFLELNRKAKIYMRRDAVGLYYNAKGYIGLDPQLKASDRIVFVDAEEYPLAEGLTLYGSVERTLYHPLEKTPLRRRPAEGSPLEPDLFLHEQYLEIREGGKTYLMSGCSHRGILNITRWFRPDVLIGGFHFKDVEMDEAGRAHLEEAARELLEYPTRYYTGHCTGLEQFTYLKTFLGERLEYIPTGAVLEIR